MNSVSILGDRFRDALAYAASLHECQVRKGTAIPYISHPMAVASLVLEAGGTETEAIAALLHDGPEDCGGMVVLEEIRDRFGDDVANIVDACTDTFENPKPAWRPRKEAYLARLPDESASIHLVSSADKLHNATAIVEDFRRVGPELWSRFSADAPSIWWYYENLARIFRLNGKTPLLSARLDRAVQEVAQIAGGLALLQ